MHTPSAKYILLDGARLRDFLQQAQEMNPDHISLYRGRSEEMLANVAPYLFAYEAGSPFASFVDENGEGQSWGIFVESQATLEELHKHFRQFLMVNTQDGRELYFRFYDPRVMRIFLPTCSPEQLTALFGPVRTYIMEEQGKGEAVRFSLLNGRLQQEKFSYKLMGAPQQEMLSSWTVSAMVQKPVSPAAEATIAAAAPLPAAVTAEPSAARQASTSNSWDWLNNL